MYGAYGELCLFRHVATFSFVAQLRWRAATKERKNRQRHRQRKSSPISFLAAPRPTDIKSNKPRSKTYERALLCRVPDNLLQSKALRNENQRYCSPVSTERLIRSSGKPVAKQSKSPCSARMPYLTEESQVTRITTSPGKFI